MGSSNDFVEGRAYAAGFEAATSLRTKARQFAQEMRQFAADHGSAGVNAAELMQFAGRLEALVTEHERGFSHDAGLPSAAPHPRATNTVLQPDPIDDQITIGLDELELRRRLHSAEGARDALLDVVARLTGGES